MIIDADPEKSELLVVPVSDQAKAPQWLGELPPVPAEVARDIGRLRWLIAEDLKLIESSKLEKSFDQIKNLGLLIFFLKYSIDRLIYCKVSLVKFFDLILLFL